MPKFHFHSSDLRHGFALSGIVKPESGDVCLKFLRDKLIVFASDNRRFARIFITPKSVDGVADDYNSDEFYFLSERMSFFDTDLESVIVSVTQNSLNVTASAGEETRQASLKRKSSLSTRPSIPEVPSGKILCNLDAKLFDDALRQVSCSALIKETKTDETRRQNQVHFYSEESCIVSNARFFGSTVFFDSLAIDLSIVSDDVPLIRSFCSKCKGQIQLSQESKILYVKDIETGSVLATSQINAGKPPLMLLKDNFPTIIEIDKEKLSKALDWACLSLTQEGTFRLSLVAEGNKMKFLISNQEISEFPIQFIQGNKLKQDYNAKHLSSIIDFINSSKVILKHGNSSNPTILEISSAEAPESNNAPYKVRAKHYLQNMRQH